MAQLSASMPAQTLLQGRRKDKTEQGKAGDMKIVLSPSSFLSIFCQAAHTEKETEESATVTPVALAWKPFLNCSEGFDSGFKSWYTVLYICFSVWQMKQTCTSVFVPRVTSDKKGHRWPKFTSRNTFIFLLWWQIQNYKWINRDCTI